MRLIDADALKEHKFVGNKFIQIGGRTNGKTLEAVNKAYQQGWNDAIDAIIDNAPTVAEIFKSGSAVAVRPIEERQQGEWIPVSERLPEQANQSYLVTVDYGDGLISSCQRFFFGEGIGWNDDCVIAWQPLPEPYKKGGAE